MIMKAAYYETKAKIVALATGYYDGDEATRQSLYKAADFFPIARPENDPSGPRSMVIRVGGEIFLVEDTRGGETGVFSLLLPVM
jgi:hypothetical protein